MGVAEENTRKSLSQEGLKTCATFGEIKEASGSHDF